MELLRLRRRLALAQRGYKLLQDKLDVMMRRFLKLIKETYIVNEQVKKSIKQIFLRLVVSRCLTRGEDFTQAIKNTRPNLDFESSLVRIVGVSIPKFRLRKLKMELDYNFSRMSPELDLALNELKDCAPSLLRLAGLLKNCQLLAFEIEATRRRVNALEYLLIPSISQTIRLISDRLNELERESLLRLMRIKDILR